MRLRGESVERFSVKSSFNDEKLYSPVVNYRNIFFRDKSKVSSCAELNRTLHRSMREWIYSCTHFLTWGLGGKWSAIHSSRPLNRRLEWLPEPARAWCPWEESTPLYRAPVSMLQPSHHSNWATPVSDYSSIFPRAKTKRLALHPIEEETRRACL
jgi:hypothetical protein